MDAPDRSDTERDAQCRPLYPVSLRYRPSEAPTRDPCRHGPRTEPWPVIEPKGLRMTRQRS